MFWNYIRAEKSHLDVLALQQANGTEVLCIDGHQLLPRDRHVNLSISQTAGHRAEQQPEHCRFIPSEITEPAKDQ